MSVIRTYRFVSCGALLLTVIAGCSSDESSTASVPPSTSSEPAAASTSSEPAAASTDATEAVASSRPQARCPNADGGPSNHCVGALDAGTYATAVFEPTLTYTVPAGWSNMEDLPGNFLLIPPGGSLAGVNPGTSDYLGVYTSIAAPLGCEERPDPSVATTVDAYVGWLQQLTSVVVSEPRPINVGGVTGVEVDVSMSADPGCSDSSTGDGYSQVLVGQAPSSLLHGVFTDYPLRLDLFDQPNKTILAIELADAPHGGSDFDDWWTAAADVTKTFEFGT